MDSTDQITQHWGDIASVLGLVVSILGFALTIKNVKKAKDAAQQALEAAQAARRSLMAANALVDFAKAQAIMEEIRRLNRQGAWVILPDRYSALKTALMSLRTEHPNLSDSNNTAITGSLAQLRTIERKIEEALAKNVQPDGVAKMNQVLSGQIERIGEIVVSLKQEVKA